MNEIDKLYENAGINKIFKYYECSYGTSSIQVCPIPLGDCIGMCDRKSIWEYPPFIAEKQLNLIKWLIQKNFYDERIIRSNIDQTYFYCTYIDDYGDYCESEYFEKFEEALANLFNYFWQSLTPEEKQQIKEILE